MSSPIVWGTRYTRAVAQELLHPIFLRNGGSARIRRRIMLKLQKCSQSPNLLATVDLRFTLSMHLYEILLAFICVYEPNLRFKSVPHSVCLSCVSPHSHSISPLLLSMLGQASSVNGAIMEMAYCLILWREQIPAQM